MLKAAFGLIGTTLVSLVFAVSGQQGCRDLRRAVTHLGYYSTRDMRTTVALDPARGFLREPDTTAVPTTGVDRPLAGLQLTPDERDAFAATFVNPVAPDDSSIARGERKFRRTCMPCHGKTMVGDGTVAPMFMPPPDLLAEPTRARKDGFIYSYVRHGGIVMPSYGAQVTRAEAYDLINYIRHMQKTSPR
jgi:mono/diheme cytochrome c family protein